MTENPEVYEEKIEDERVVEFVNQTHSLGEFIRVQPYKCIFPKGYIKYEDQIKNTEILEEDIWIASHTKCGTRWMQEIVWLLRNNLDYEKSSKTPLDMRVPFFEMAVADVNNFFGGHASFDWVKNTPPPRIIKTHLSYEMLPKQLIKGNNKIVVIMRNPRDVCCSLFNHFRITDNYTGTRETLTNAFLADLAPYWGPYFVNTLSYWNQRHKSNIFIVWYEELQRDFATEAKKLAQFLNVPLADEDIPKFQEHVSFDSFKKNAMVNMDSTIQVVKEKLNSKVEGSMINKGKTGYWKEVFDDETIKRFEEWEAKWLKDSDLKLIFEI